MEQSEKSLQKFFENRERKNRFLCTAPDVVDFVMTYTSRDETSRELLVDETFQSLPLKQIQRLQDSFSFIDDLRQTHDDYEDVVSQCFLISDEEFVNLKSMISDAVIEQV